MKKNTPVAKTLTEETFLPELEAEEARLKVLLQTARDESVAQIQSARIAADASTAKAHQACLAEISETRRLWLLKAAEARKNGEATVSGELESWIAESRRRVPAAVERLTSLVCGFEESP